MQTTFLILISLLVLVVLIYFVYMTLSKKRIAAIKKQNTKSKFVLTIGKNFHCEFYHDEKNCA